VARSGPVQHDALPVRYDERSERYRDCRWCGGRGCLACPGEAKKAYEAAFPGGAKPIATFDMTTDEGQAGFAEMMRKIGGLGDAGT
jgi:hypothetical protein